MKRLSRFALFLLLNIFSILVVSAQGTIWKVGNAGAMREMFQTGNVAGTIETAKLSPRKNLYGVGPLEGLSGEIMIWNGRPLTSFMENQTVQVKTDSEAKAVFFVWANVRKWRSVKIPANIATYDELEKFISEAAAKAGLDPAEPLPFLIKGMMKSVDWHVNDYRPDGTKLTREKHDADKYKANSSNVKLEMLGFFSPKHKGVFTHHTRTTHIHVTDSKRTFVGHVDDLKPGGKIRLYLPVM